MQWFFTADEHYGHTNIIKYCARPFKTISEMDNMLIANHNSVVMSDDIVVHAGDFTMGKTYQEVIKRYINRLNGQHVFIKGSHDRWLGFENAPYIWERTIEGQFIVVCHYAMRTWAKSHYNSWQLYGHSHGRLPPQGKQWDVGVDNNNFYPISFRQLAAIMKTLDDNTNLVHHAKRG